MEQELPVEGAENNDGDLDELDDDELVVRQSRLTIFLSKYTIPPDNSRLKKFQLLVNLSLYLDFAYTSLLMGNYLFQIGEYDPNFMSHHSVFVYLILVQGIDIFLTFFKVVKVEGMKPETDP